MSSEKSHIMALDLSLTNTGIAIFNEKEEIVFITSVSTNRKDNYPVRLKTISDAIKTLAKKYNPSVVVIERGFTKFYASTQALFRVQGVVMLTLCGYEQIFYAPTIIKKCVTGKGNASKNFVLEKVIERYPDIKIEDTDQSDAIAVGITYFQKLKEGDVSAKRNSL